MFLADLMYVNQNNKHVFLVQGESRPGGHWLLHAGKVVRYSVFAIVLMVVIKVGIKIQNYCLISEMKCKAKRIYTCECVCVCVLSCKKTNAAHFIF